jgi:hypothetical protein
MQPIYFATYSRAPSNLRLKEAAEQTQPHKSSGSIPKTETKTSSSPARKKPDVLLLT